MNAEINLARLGAIIKSKRLDDELGLRDAAKESGLSPSTLSRLERGIGSSPDADTIAKLSKWLNIAVGKLIFENEPEYDKPHDLTTPEFVEVHLRADKNLSAETANSLAQMFRILYDQLSGQKPLDMGN